MDVINKNLDEKMNASCDDCAVKPSLSRIASLYGEEAVGKLAASHVAIFGIGGVGGHAACAVARSGVGKITIVDKDVVEESNLNRQIVATYDTIGLDKVSVMKERIKSINPDCEVYAVKMFYGVEAKCEIACETAGADDEAAGECETAGEQLDFSTFDYVIDAVDNVTAKLKLIEDCKAAGVPIICSMGTAGKKDAGAFEVTMLSKTFGDGLAKVMRRECKKRGLGDVRVVFSREESQAGSAPHVPPVAGLMLAGEVINYLTRSNL